MIADVYKRKIRNVVIKTCTERRRISLLKDVKSRKRFDEKVIVLVDICVANLLGHYKVRVLWACD